MFLAEINTELEMCLATKPPMAVGLCSSLQLPHLHQPGWAVALANQRHWPQTRLPACPRKPSAVPEALNLLSFLWVWDTCCFETPSLSLLVSVKTPLEGYLMICEHGVNLDKQSDDSVDSSLRFCACCHHTKYFIHECHIKTTATLDED